MIDPAAQPLFASVQPTAGVQPCAPDAASAARGARFQALLEELDLRAQSVAKSAREPLSAEALPEAVLNARTSLENALALSQSLLEEFRQTSAQSSATRSARP